MTRPNITPGPWINNADTVYMGQKPAFLAVCSPWNHLQSVANARAIAAVPALLEALEMLVKESGRSLADLDPDISGHKPLIAAYSALTAAGYQF